MPVYIDQNWIFIKNPFSGTPGPCCDEYWRKPLSHWKPVPARQSRGLGSWVSWEVIERSVQSLLLNQDDGWRGSCQHGRRQSRSSGGGKVLEVDVLQVRIRDGHADIFADTHRCGYPHYPTYVGYSAIYAAHISDRHGVRICMAIPSVERNFGKTARIKQWLKHTYK